MTRRDDFITICATSGAHVIDAGNGWPGRASLALADGSIRELLIHAGPLTTHARGIVGEVRLQPPGQNRPVQDDYVALPLIIGVTRSGILIAVDAYRRVGRNERWTVTFREGLVAEAARHGWAATERPVHPEGVEYIYAFRAALLSVYVEMIARGVNVDSSLLTAAVAGAGLTTAPNNAEAKERARQATSRLIRAAAFSKDVLNAYGNKCALCGLGLGLVVGAHVLPAAAPGSPDEVWNGVCLCENHHRAFDKHLIYVEPTTRVVRLHPQVHEEATVNAAARAFLNGTVRRLRSTGNPILDIATEMLVRRYQYFDGLYNWAL